MNTLHCGQRHESETPSVLLRFFSILLHAPSSEPCTVQSINREGARKVWIFPTSLCFAISVSSVSVRRGRILSRHGPRGTHSSSGQGHARAKSRRPAAWPPLQPSKPRPRRTSRRPSARTTLSHVSRWRPWSHHNIMAPVLVRMHAAAVIIGPRGAHL